MKKVAVIADLHCGHRYGLTPPGWPGRSDFSRALWRFYSSEIRAFAPDILVVNGDAIDGKRALYGGRGLIELDRHKQAEMAAEAILESRAKKVYLLRGTRYHVGQDEDFEDSIVFILQKNNIHAEIHNHLFLKVEKRILDIKHKISRSIIPHGKGSPLAKAALWNRLYYLSERRQPKADIFIRSHVHYFLAIEEEDWLGIITPALTYFSEYGIRECESVVHVGFIIFEFHDDGSYSWGKVLMKSPALHSEIVVA